jgi:hypothetical protein
MTSAKLLFESDAPKLREQMLAATSTAEAMQIVQSYLRQLGSTDGKYIPELSVVQSHIVLDMLGHLRQVLSLSNEGNLFDIESAARIRPSDISTASEHALGRLPKRNTLIGIAAAGLVSGLVSSGLVAVAAGVSAGMIATIATAEVLERAAPADSGTEALPSQSERNAALAETYDHLLDLIASFLESLDAVVTEVTPAETAFPIAQEQPRGLESFPSVLAYLQRLAGIAREQESIPSALQEILGQDLIDLLSEFSLWLDTDFEAHSDRFDRRKASAGGLGRTRVVQPAVLMGETVVLKGYVVDS